MTVVPHMQDDFQTEDDQLGQGINCSVLACHSTALAGVVLKKGPSLVLADEAKMMRLVSHPCVIRLHGTVHRDENDADYLGIEELGDDLAKVMDYRRCVACLLLCSCAGQRCCVRGMKADAALQAEHFGVCFVSGLLGTNQPVDSTYTLCHVGIFSKQQTNADKNC